MKICERDVCSNVVLRKSGRYCSLSCSNYARILPKRGRTMYTSNCLNCSKEIVYDRKNRKYCSRKCSTQVSNAKRIKYTVVPCPWCYTSIKNKKYCDTQCRQKFEVYEWLAGRLSGQAKYEVKSFVRLYVFSRSGGQCEGIDSRTAKRCTEDRVVQLDHIDGDPYNSIAENLRHLCPTCHTLTPTYAGKNRGNGRAWKSMYNQYKTT